MQVGANGGKEDMMQVLGTYATWGRPEEDTGEPKHQNRQELDKVWKMNLRLPRFFSAHLLVRPWNPETTSSHDEPE